MGADVRILVLSGSMGAGKTTVLGVASGQLGAADVRHAALDLDHLGQGHYVETAPDDLMLRNLATVWRNYADAGATHALLAKPIDSIAKRDQLGAAIPATEILVCRLRAELATMQQRVRVREPGPNQDHFVNHAATLENYLDAAGVEDFSIDNDNRAAGDVAQDMLRRAGWL